MCTPENLSNVAFCKSVLSKAIYLMAEDADLSPLLLSAVKLLAHSDLGIKKAAGQIIIRYQSTNPDAVLLGLNSLIKDCYDSSPMVRGQALKVMCSIRQLLVLEYAEPAIFRAFSDKSAFVRRTAVLACVKLYSLSNTFITESGIIDELYSMIRDPDPLVVTNCLCVLDEVLMSEGGIVINRGIAHYLLNRLDSFSNWSQSYVLQILCKYSPSSEDEIFDIMNVTDVLLKNNSIAVVDSCLQLFLHLLENMPHLQLEVCNRVKDAVVSQLGSGNVELIYCVVDQVKKLPQDICKVYAPEHKSFFCRHKDPCYLVNSKVTFLPRLVTKTTYKVIVEELCLHVTDRSAKLSLAAVKAIANIACDHKEAFEDCLEQLNDLLSSSSEQVVSNVLQTLKTIDLSDSKQVVTIITSVASSHRMVRDESGTVAMLCLLDTYGCDMPDTPYILEDLVENFDSISTGELKHQLLCTVMKVFLSRPAECQHILGALLELCVDDQNKALQGTAILYYDLLETGFSVARQVVTGLDRTQS
ncbi:AP-4 complex subunit beta-1-like [Gigantopelta aegis]|uniref:AP-4 complex subunit beta-1-like n=1 Tax=Gigantopelta aegis TaxID=1735272 RepID=UPI001B88B7DB|nr:AP-4 complex subunit beta-1-like [Gigantopelta aegis]